jgi:hypothetical protein
VAKDPLGRIIPTSTFGEVPLLGLVKAGFPADAPDVLETTINLNNFLIQKKDSTYILEVDGDNDWYVWTACVSVVIESTDLFNE